VPDIKLEGDVVLFELVELLGPDLRRSSAPRKRRRRPLVINVTRYSEEETEARMGTSINIFYSIVSFQTETFNSFPIFIVIGQWSLVIGH